MIKIKIPLQHEELSCEGVWVEEHSHNTGEINNLPFFTAEYKYRDVIEFDPETSVALRLVKDGGYTPTKLIEYEGEYSAERVRWEKEGYVVEGFHQGLLGITRKRF